MNYEPGPVPIHVKDVLPYLHREGRKLSAAIKDSALTVFYRTSVDTDPSLSAGISANYKAELHANILRISTSNTVTLTGIADTTPNRERVLINIGTGVLVLKSQGTESSASHRFALPADWQISANGSATIWYDVISSRHRGINRT